jgi:predicted transcriptional regulator
MNADEVQLVQLGMRVPLSLRQAIKVLSGRTNVPMERIVEQAIAQYLEQQQGNIAA